MDQVTVGKKKACAGKTSNSWMLSAKTTGSEFCTVIKALSLATFAISLVSHLLWNRTDAIRRRQQFNASVLHGLSVVT
jgi:hypothetical protein